MIKSKFIKAFVLGVCIASMSLGMAFANPTLDTPVSYTAPELEGIDQKIVDKHAEIDRYIFADHVEEIKKQGFTVTHTGPFKDYVEIGITPYSEENANYLYKIFGKDMVKVVKGEQAEIMITGADGPATSYINELATTTSDDLMRTTAVEDSDIQLDAVTVLVEDVKAETSKLSLLILYTVGALAVLGGGIIVKMKLK